MNFATNHPQMRVEQAKFEKDCPIWFFGGRNVDPTSTCNVTIEYGNIGLGESGLRMRNSLLRALKIFNDFKNVVVKTEQESVCDIWALTRFPLTHENLVRLHLESALGLATVVEDEDRRMELRPRQNPPSLHGLMHLRQATDIDDSKDAAALSIQPVKASGRSWTLVAKIGAGISRS